jgi:LysR family transcriptional regulator, mexEF-oprN operon transcriptional activator
MNYSFNEIEFRGIDLNILLAFSALMRERSVTRAAERLYLGPSAVSMSLKRLRELFDDPLLIRGRDGLEPTAKAHELAARVEKALAEIHGIVFHSQSFDPATVSRHFRFGAPDELEVVLVPALLRVLLARAPGIRLSIRQANFRNAAAALDSGDIDLALTAKPLNLQAWHTCDVMHQERFACLFDAKQLSMKANEKITLKKYLAIPHLLQSPSGDQRGAIDERLSEMSLSRKVLMTASNFQTMPFVLKQIPCLLNMPETGARFYAKAFNLTICELPISSPTFQVALLTHQRNNSDPALQWFKSIVIDIVETLVTEGADKRKQTLSKRL